jgi:hypothetical protein
VGGGNDPRAFDNAGQVVESPTDTCVPELQLDLKAHDFSS